MGIKSFFGAMFGTKSSPTNPYNDSSFFGRLLGRNKHAGEVVDYTTAMRHNDVYTCVRIKAESLGQLPVKLYRTEAGVKTEILSGREHNIFTKRPNPYQTWQEFIEQFATSYELLGKFAAEIKRNRFGNVYEIRPFKFQNNFRAEMNENGEIYYTYATNDGKGNVETQTYKPSDVLYIKSFTLDGYSGISTISQCALAIGSAIAGEKHAASLFENGAMPMGVLQTDESFGNDEEAIARLRKQWSELHSGTKNSGKTAVLEYGLKYQQLTMTAVDAQLLEQRKFTREQIASMFRVPLHMLQAATGMKYANVEQNNISFFRDALMPLVTKLENAVNILLPANHEIKLNERAFVRGDRKQQVDTISAEIKSGLCSLNEGREELGRSRIEGGDVFAIQTNNLTFGTYEDIAKIQEQQRQLALEKPKPSPVGNPSQDEETTT